MKNKKLFITILSALLILTLTACSSSSRNECCECEACSCSENNTTAEKSDSEDGKTITNSETDIDSQRENSDDISQTTVAISDYGYSNSEDSKDNLAEANEEPLIDIDSDDPAVIANAYVALYNSGVWSGRTTTYKDSEVFCNREGEIYINDEPTGIKTDERLTYDKAKDSYLNETWNGELQVLDGKKVYRSNKNGYLYVDDFSLEKNIDLPEDFDYNSIDSRMEYVPDCGLVFLDDNHLKTFVRGEAQNLPGNNLVYEGIDLNSYTIVDPFLRYIEEWDLLILVVPAISNEFIGTVEFRRCDLLYAPENVLGLRQYFYVFPDSSSSQIQLISEIKWWCTTYDIEHHLSFIDTSDVSWEYVENKGFVQSHPNN